MYVKQRIIVTLFRRNTDHWLCHPGGQIIQPFKESFHRACGIQLKMMFQTGNQKGELDCLQSAIFQYPSARLCDTAGI